MKVNYINFCKSIFDDGGRDRRMPFHHFVYSKWSRLSDVENKGI